MGKPKLLNGYVNQRDAELEIFGQTVLAQMTSNDYFPTPVPALTVLTEALSDYSAALTDAQSRDKVSVEDKDQKKVVLASVLTQLGDYVTMVAKGDRLIMLDSGFKVSMERQPGPDVTAPQNVQLSDGINAGELLIKCDAVPGVRTYLYQYTQNAALPEKDWTQQNCTQCKLLVTGLEGGKRYFFRIIAMGKGAQKAYSEVVSRVTQ